MSKIKTISILGCGWLGLPLAKFFVAKGYQVKGSTTTESKLSLLKENSIEPYLIRVGDQTIEGNISDFLQGTDVLIINFPPKRIPDIRKVYPQQTAMIIEHLSKDQKTIFVSSTSVYQNTNSKVWEDMQTEPEKDAGKAILEAEQMLHFHLRDNITVLRLAGLVGHDRLPGRFLAEKKDLKNGNAPVNVIHQEDCIGLINQVLELDKWGDIYNGCADKHPLRKDYYTRAAEVIGLTPPTFKNDPDSQFKIVGNEKSKKELDYQYKYPDPIQML